MRPEVRLEARSAVVATDADSHRAGGRVRRLDGRTRIRQRPQPPGAQFVNTVIGLLGAEALPA
jgi:hypothetical protein